MPPSSVRLRQDDDRRVRAPPAIDAGPLQPWMSGSPRSRITRSGDSASNRACALPPARRLDDLIALVPSPVRSSFRIGTSSSTTRIFTGAAPGATSSYRLPATGTGKMIEDGTGATRRSAGHDRATDRLDETGRRSRAQRETGSECCVDVDPGEQFSVSG